MNQSIAFPAANSATHARYLPAWAIVLSLLVHFALLAGPFLQRKTIADLPPLSVSLRLPPIGAPAASEPVSQVRPVTRSAPLPSLRPAVGERQPKPVAAPALLTVAGPVPETATANPVNPLAVPPAALAPASSSTSAP